jgi:hypothetical protein
LSKFLHNRFKGSLIGHELQKVGGFGLRSSGHYRSDGDAIDFLNDIDTKLITHPRT